MPLPLPDVLEIVRAPGRAKRPKRVAIVLRGPPGSGKSHLARLLRDAEVAAGGQAPRIHSIDDYFITVSAAPLTGCSCHGQALTDSSASAICSIIRVYCGALGLHFQAWCRETVSAGVSAVSLIVLRPVRCPTAGD